MVRVIQGSPGLARETDATAATRSITVPDTISIAKSSDSVEVHVLDWTGDGVADVFVLGTDVASGTTAGYLFSGSGLASGNLTKTRPCLP